MLLLSVVLRVMVLYCFLIDACNGPSFLCHVSILVLSYCTVAPYLMVLVLWLCVTCPSSYIFGMCNGPNVLCFGLLVWPYLPVFMAACNGPVLLGFGSACRPTFQSYDAV